MCGARRTPRRQVASAILAACAAGGDAERSRRCRRPARIGGKPPNAATNRSFGESVDRESCALDGLACGRDRRLKRAVRRHRVRPDQPVGGDRDLIDRRLVDRVSRLGLLLWAGQPPSKSRAVAAVGYEDDVEIRRRRRRAVDDFEPRLGDGFARRADEPRRHPPSARLERRGRRDARHNRVADNAYGAGANIVKDYRRAVVVDRLNQKRRSGADHLKLDEKVVRGGAFAERQSRWRRRRGAVVWRPVQNVRRIVRPWAPSDARRLKSQARRGVEAARQNFVKPVRGAFKGDQIGDGRAQRLVSPRRRHRRSKRARKGVDVAGRR